MKPIMRRIDEYRERLGVNLRFQSYWRTCTIPRWFSRPWTPTGFPGHACEFETSTMMALAPERVHAEAMVNEAAMLATKEKGERLHRPGG